MSQMDKITGLKILHHTYIFHVHEAYIASEMAQESFNIFCQFLFLIEWGYTNKKPSFWDGEGVHKETTILFVKRWVLCEYR